MPTSNRHLRSGSSNTQEAEMTPERVRNLISEAIQEALPGLLEATFTKFANRIHLLEKENDSLRRRVQALEDDKYSKELEVCGIPERESEDLIAVSKSILSKLKLDDGNVRAGALKAYRLPRKKTTETSEAPTRSPTYPPKVIVQLSSVHIKRVAYSNRIKHKITAKDLGFNDSDNQIFINERLRPELRIVYGKLLGLKRDDKILSLWTHNQQIMVKVSKTDKPEVVNDFDVF